MAEPAQCKCKTCKKMFPKRRTRSDANPGSGKLCKSCLSTARVREWRKNNPERNKEINKQPTKEQKQRYAKSARGQEVNRAKETRWKENNPGRKAELAREAYHKDPDRFIQKVVDRSKRLRNASPKWLTGADKKLIAKIYRRARYLTKKTGILHHVDHVIPLNGELVCGLHVPSNLQILIACVNQAKGNYFDPAEFATTVTMIDDAVTRVRKAKVTAT